MSCREKVGVFFVELGILEPQTAHLRLRSAAISRHLKSSVGRPFLRSRLQLYVQKIAVCIVSLHLDIRLKESQSDGIQSIPFLCA
jgi:hypothetical protein